MNLRLRLALATAAGVAFSAVATAAVVFYVERDQLLSGADADLRKEVESITTQLETGGLEAAMIPPDGGQQYRIHGQLVGSDGSTTALETVGPRLPLEDETVALAQGRGDRFYSSAVVDGERLRLLTVPTLDGALVVARSMDDVDEQTRHLGLLLALVVLVALGLATVLGDLVARTAVRPVTALSAASERLTRDRALRQRLDVDSPEELRRLADSINGLMDSLDDAQRSQSQLVADAAHELKTPLTTIWTNLEVLAATRSLGVADVERILADIREEVAGLIEAANDLLELARDEPVDIGTDEVALEEVVEEVVAAARRTWPEVEFSATVSPRLVVGQRSRIWRAVRNLVDNAAKWSPAGGVVDVRLERDRLTVRDRGPGIPPEELQHVFERFYRAKHARAMPGSGLGLAIVQKIVTEHGWRVSAENCPDGGARFCLHLRSEPSTSSSRSTRAVPGSSEQASKQVRRPRRLLVAGGLTAAVGALVVGNVLRSAPGSTHETSLVSLTGTLELCGTNYCVEGSVADFGPDWYVANSLAAHDYDGNGQRDLLGEELAGLLRTQVILETDGGELDEDVYTINGMPFRDDTGQLPEPPEARSKN
jgi:two-component system sensor histidine kinase MprB